MERLIPKIGLEIHLELKTKTKMFCSCPNDPEEIHPNINICEVCTGQPGVLPVVNKTAIEYAIKLAKALNCKINNISYFARKNYFYPDLPKNYQISQYDLPLAINGYLEFYVNEEPKKVRIRRIHLEEDTGKLIHIENYSLVDFNRAGVPLLEIVTEPDIRSAEEAKEFVEELILIIRYLDISDASPEKGEIRFEANISVAEGDKLGTKVEVKNIGSIRSLKDAIDYEIKRQTKLLKEGKEIIQETRGFDETKRITYSQRTKEFEQDYRYFPEPDLPPLILEANNIDQITIPELPNQKRIRYQEEFNLSFKEADILTKNKKLAEFYEEVISEIKKEFSIASFKTVYNLLVNDFLGFLTKYNKNLEDISITPLSFSKLVKNYLNNSINIKIVKDVLEKVVSENKEIEVLLKEKEVIIDRELIEKLVEEAINNNPNAVSDFKKGKESALQFLIGYVMKVSKGQADINLTKEILIEKLKND
jgi:aspartyl-tRNA(Asn)/glutamyl-tRNA(Gln) amidotransferase subunit B